ncbi:hypothetical protein KM043_013074 [Ampulex compressa]|nr:hypothetical protein KM043_013074 [Ampulex compressa]
MWFWPPSDRQPTTDQLRGKRTERLPKGEPVPRCAVPNTIQLSARGSKRSRSTPTPPPERISGRGDDSRSGYSFRTPGDIAGTRSRILRSASLDENYFPPQQEKGRNGRASFGVMLLDY